jgi:hypothetical protein
MPTEDHAIYKHQDGSYARLTSDNWHQWKEDCYRHLVSRCCWHVVAADVAPPVMKNGNKAEFQEVMEDYKKATSTAQGIIYAATSQDLRVHPKNVINPHQMWKALKEYCSAGNRLGRFGAIADLLKCQPLPGEKLGTFFNRLMISTTTASSPWHQAEHLEDILPRHDL